MRTPAAPFGRFLLARFAPGVRTLCRTARMSESVVEVGAKRAPVCMPPSKRRQKVKVHKPKPVDAVSSEGVLRRNIADLFPDAPQNDMTAFFNRDRAQPWPLHQQNVPLTIAGISHNGLGIGFSGALNSVVVVPFTYPGEDVVVDVVRTEQYYVMAELRTVEKPAAMRDDTLVFCQYFGARAGCAGCQYQSASYAQQLELKRQVVVNAYRYFAPSLQIPAVRATVASPLPRGYRTKLTPHFDVPKQGLQPNFPIGFGHVLKNEVVDIEECAIGTRVVNEGLQRERARVRDAYKSFKRGATLLLREAAGGELVTDPKAVMRETVGEFSFSYKAGEFFQNNNSILPLVTAYVAQNLQIDGVAPEYLVDTYCGCGLFAIACSANAKQVLGVEISAQNVEFARLNAVANGVHNAEFVVGQAERIFARAPADSARTAVVIDPPRKGCDEAFLNQLLAFGPARIVYVSCNVHSQARDLAYFVAKSAGAYEVESVGGFDFFPQTYHVESVAVLRRTHPASCSPGEPSEPVAEATSGVATAIAASTTAAPSAASATAELEASS